MSNHGSLAEKGDLVRVLDAGGRPTNYLGVVMGVRFDSTITGPDRKMLLVAADASPGPAQWSIASYFRIVARGVWNA